MRQPGLCDLDAAVRVLLARPSADWAGVAARLIRDAHVSDRIRKRLLRAPKGRGTGSLASEAMHWRRLRTRAPCDPQYCAALGVVLAALATWRGDLGRLSGAG